MAPVQSKPATKKDTSKSPTKRGSRSSTSSATNNQASSNSNASNANRTFPNMNPANAQGGDNDALLQYLRANSSPLANSIRLAGSPKSGQNGPRKAIIVVHILHKNGGIHGYVYGFRRFEEPNRGTYIEKIHRDQVRSRDPALVDPPLNIMKTTYGAHENGEPRFNEKGYELSAFVSIQNFAGKTEQTVRQLAKMFATAIKNHIERDPACQNQDIVVSDDNIHYNEDHVFMDFVGERNAVNLYRTILPVDSTPGYSTFFVEHARSFFHEGSLSPNSVALIKSSDIFLAPEERNDNQEQGENESNEHNNNNNQHHAGEA